MYTAAILLAAGEGRRLASQKSKPLVAVNSIPLILYSLSTFSRHPLIRDIVVVANSGNRSAILRIIKRCRIGKVRNVVLGGRQRQDSMRCGFNALAAGTELAVIHDAARPFIGRAVISSAIAAAGKSGAAIVGVPVNSTIKRVERTGGSASSRLSVTATVDRRLLWEAQTPQVFKTDLLRRAFERYGTTAVTDDAMLVERLGHPVTTVRGSAFNIKITAPEDLVIAESIAKYLYRTGRGGKIRMIRRA